MIIEANSTVTLYFSLALESGDIVDSNFDKEPATFTIGDGSLFESFEQVLLGLNKGDRVEKVINKAQAFGAVNPNNVQQFKRGDFPADATLEQGAMFSFADAAGNELPGVLKSVTDTHVEIDFNHPLAGHNITFTAEIIDVE